MKKIWKQRWLKALRNGKYKQGRYTLRTQEDRFCCLGVLCDVVAIHEGKQWKFDGSYWAFGKATTALSSSVLKIVGLTAHDPVILGTSLTIRNDAKKQSFKRIADLIEKHL